MHFFKKGKQYRIITPRLDSRHIQHFFEVGEIVTCHEVYRPNSKSSKQFSRPNLRGEFTNSKGIEQTLYTGDVVAL